MDEFTFDAFLNRDEPIPVIVLDPAEDLSDEASNRSAGGATPSRKRDRIKKHASNMKENMKKAHEKVSEIGPSMQDRLLDKCAQLSCYQRKAK
jgi:hypothetical protein